MKTPKQYLTEWLQKLLGCKKCHDKITEVHNLVVDRTTVNADIDYRGMGSIIFIGHYKKRDYIQCFKVNQGDFEGFLKELLEARREGRIDIVDAPPQFKASIDTSLRHVWGDSR